jgi:hypothetical protein
MTMLPFTGLNSPCEGLLNDVLKWVFGSSVAAGTDGL